MGTTQWSNKKRGWVGTERYTTALLKGSYWKERHHSTDQRTVYVANRNFAHHSGADSGNFQALSASVHMVALSLCTRVTWGL